MRVGMLLLLWWLSPMSAWADEQVLQSLHEIRTRSYLLCSSAMLYFNPAIKTADPRVLASNYDSLNLLATRTVQLEQPPLMVETQRDMQLLVKALERLPRQQAEEYPALLVQLLELRRQAEEWADAQYQQQSAAGNAASRELRQQSLDMARMLLDYQARAYPFPAGSYQGLGGAQLEVLDRHINARFERLMGAYVEPVASLSGARKNYRFVRAQLLASTPPRSSGGIEFYLTRSIIDLDELAVHAVEPQPQP